MSTKSGFVSNGTTGMIVSSTPSPQLAYTNLCYTSPSDVHKFSVPGSNLAYALISDSFVLSVHASDSIDRGCIGLNAIHRRHAKVSVGDMVPVSRFIPPDEFNLALLWVELDFVKRGNKDIQVDAALLTRQIHKMFISQVMTLGQKVPIEYLGTNYIITINQATLDGQEKSDNIERGIISADTCIIFEASNSSGIKIVNQHEGVSANIFKQKEFNLQSLGIGGLSAEFTVIFRRAFASRVFPQHVISKLGIKHVKGMLLYGPPGTGKTLMARQIGKMLDGVEPKIVNGPDVLSKYVGESEKNVRNLFAEAEHDEKTLGDQSKLHVIIFDEIDAICKARGSTRDGTGVHDGIVNQLLTKIDGVDSLNNVLLIGMTNRKDLLDTALLRPGRLELQVQISLPDENGRLEILQIHTKKMKENSYLASDVNFKELAVMTKNYSGAELEGLVKSAVAFAINKHLSPDDLTKQINDENIKVTMEDFLIAFQELVPAFGTSTDDLEGFRRHGMVKCGLRHNDIHQRIMLLVEQVRVSVDSEIISCLLEGPRGSGKSAMAATIGIDSDFPYVKIVSAQSMVGFNESRKCEQILKVFEDAYISQLSIIILDDIEALVDYDGRAYSRSILLTLRVLLTKFPPKGKKILIIGTTNENRFLQTVGISQGFTGIEHVPTLNSREAKMILEQLNVFRGEDIDSAAEALNEIPLKMLYTVIKKAEACGGGDKIEVADFLNCLEHTNINNDVDPLFRGSF